MTRNAYRIVLVSWVAFVTSFFLPATNILQMAGTVPGTPLTGWEAFTVSIYAGVFNFWAWLGDLRVLVFAFFPFTNAVMFIAPACSCLGRYAFAPALILVPATLLPWLLPHNLLGDLFIGFYVWNGSYLTMSLGCCLLAVGCLIDDTNG
jgi:hypothetical protein